MLIPTSRFISLSEVLKNSLTSVFCTSSSVAISRAELLAHALALSETLPEKQYVINLCQDRYLFIVAYLAAFLRGQISLLPANKTPKTLLDLKKAYPDSYLLSEYEANADFVMSYDNLNISTQTFPLIDIDRTLSISFTSGSTGKPKAIAKTWHEFQSSAELAIQRFNLQDKKITLTSTVPMQHMYGLETSLFWVLFSQLILHNGRPFYPEDIRVTLKNLPTDTILVSTPRHLKSCCQIQGLWSNIRFILSSTAPLDKSLAEQIEQTLQAPLLELFGSTETLSFATRHPTLSKKWQPYAGILLTQEHGQFFVQGGHIAKPYLLDDHFEIDEKGFFRLMGRSTDTIKIAGKRASLTELNQLLMQMTGIEDAIFFASKNERLSALVVSQLPKQAILEHLKLCIDEVFMPRAIYLVPVLPRNDMGKLIKADIDQLIRKQQLARK